MIMEQWVNIDRDQRKNTKAYDGQHYGSDDPNDMYFVVF